MKIKSTTAVMLMALLLLGGFLAGAWSPVVAAGTTYFVSDAGNDDNDGTSAESPWKSLSKINATALQPGDSVSFRRGDVWTGGLFVNQSGNAKTAITLNSYGSGSLPTIIAGEGGNCVKIDGDFVTVDGLRAEACGYAGFSVSGDHNVIQNSAAAQNAAGIKVGDGSDFGHYANNTLTDNNVMNSNTPGTDCGTPQAVRCNDDSGAFGILVNGNDNEFSGNTITGSTAESYDFIRDGSAIEIFNGSRNSIHHNTAVDNNVFSEIGRSKGGAADGNTYRYNLIRSTCGDNCSKATGLIARGPTSSFGPTNNTTFENNTVWLDGPDSQAIVCHASCPSSTKIRGNILVAVRNSLWIDGSGWTEQQNVLNGPTTVTPDSTSTTAPAGFVNAPADLHLTSSSPAIDRAGTSASTADLDGQAVARNGDCTGDGAADAGAYEYHRSNC
jgi:hypothetical protein